MFKKKKQKKLKIDPIPKGLYAWNAVHAGSFLLYTESLKDCYKFMFLPGPSEYFLTKEDFEACVSNGILEFVEPLPDDIYEESLKMLACPLKI